LVFADTPFLAGITPVSEVKLLSSGQSRVLGGYQQEPSRIFRFRASPEQTAAIVRSNGMLGSEPPPGPRLYLRCGTIAPNEKNLVEKYPKMIRW